jgi:hypothetical protein
MNRRAHWHYVAIDHARTMIFIADDDGPLSVTNDAEAVTAAAASQDEEGRDIRSYRLIYRDSDGHWDELVHERGVFKGFAPARDVPLPMEAAHG